MNPRPRLRLLLALALLPLALQAQPVRLRLSWVPQAQFAGYYVAQAKGFFKEAGLDVQLIHPGGNQQTLSRKRVQSADFFVDHLSAMLRYNDTTTCDSLVLVLQTSQHASTVIVSRKPVASAADLEGKRVACWYQGRNETAKAYLKSLGVSVEWIPVESNSNAPFLVGAVDATLAMEYHELYLFQLAGLTIQPEQVIFLRNTPFDIPSDALMVKASYLRAHPKEVQAMAEAVRRGWEWLACEENQAEGLRLVQEQMQRYGNRSNAAVQRHMLATVLQLQLNGGRRPFTIGPERYAQAVKQMRAVGSISHPMPYKTFVYQLPRR